MTQKVNKEIYSEADLGNLKNILLLLTGPVRAHIFVLLKAKGMTYRGPYFN